MGADQDLTKKKIYKTVFLVPNMCNPINKAEDMQTCSAGIHYSP